MVIYSVLAIVQRVRLVPPIDYLFFVVVHNYYHPHTDLSVTSVQWCAVDITVAAFGAEARYPFYACCYAAAVHHCLEEFFADGGGAANSGKE